MILDGQKSTDCWSWVEKKQMEIVGVSGYLNHSCKGFVAKNMRWLLCLISRSNMTKFISFSPIFTLCQGLYSRPPEFFADWAATFRIGMLRFTSTNFHSFVDLSKTSRKGSS
ncbi:uncharacterized protein QC763_0078790 [Podospora pseudopauciseta]|nr:hypothetical protein QC763_0078790 [Podospora pseudopauciseta]